MPIASQLKMHYGDEILRPRNRIVIYTSHQNQINLSLAGLTTP